MSKVKGMTVKLFINGVEDHFCGDRYSSVVSSLFNDEFPIQGLRRFLTIRSLVFYLQFRLFVVKAKELLFWLKVPFLLLEPASRLNLRSLVKFWNYLVETWNGPNIKR